MRFPYTIRSAIRNSAIKNLKLNLESLEKRDTPTGGLDSTFNGGLPVMLAGQAFYAVTEQSDGKTVAVGSTSAQDGFLVERFLIDGSIDTNFGTNGIAKVPLTGG